MCSISEYVNKNKQYRAKNDINGNQALNAIKHR